MTGIGVEPRSPALLEEFADLICADPELLAAEFDAVIAGCAAAARPRRRPATGTRTDPPPDRKQSPRDGWLLWSGPEVSPLARQRAPPR